MRFGSPKTGIPNDIENDNPRILVIGAGVNGSVCAGRLYAAHPVLANTEWNNCNRFSAACQ
jgi:hypothetical protein